MQAALPMSVARNRVRKSGSIPRGSAGSSGGTAPAEKRCRMKSPSVNSASVAGPRKNHSSEFDQRQKVMPIAMGNRHDPGRFGIRKTSQSVSARKKIDRMYGSSVN